MIGVICRQQQLAQRGAASHAIKSAETCLKVGVEPNLRPSFFFG